MNKPGAKILLLCESHLPSDGRAVRFADALKKDGHEVRGACYNRSLRSPPAVSHSFDNLTIVPGPFDHPLRKYFYAATFLPGLIHGSFYSACYWLLPERRRLMRAVDGMLLRDGFKPDIVIAKHWSALPMAQKVVHATGARLIYDAVEISDAEHAENLKWRLLVKPAVRVLETAGVKMSKAVTTIGEMAGQHFQKSYPDGPEPLVVRNIPDWPRPRYRPTDAPIRFTYVGLLDQSRGLDTLLESTKLWSEGRELVLRLTGNPQQIARFKEKAAGMAIGNKVRFEPALDQNKDLQEAIWECDVGIIPFPPHSNQKQFSEPNKLYQYILAGVPVLTTPLERLGQIVEENGIGWRAEAFDAEVIGRLVNSIDASEIDQKKQKVVDFSNDLNWQSESNVLREVVDRVLMEKIRQRSG